MRGAGRARVAALAIAMLAAAFGVSEATAPAGAIGGLPLPVSLLTVTVTPVAGSIQQGGTQQYDALGTYSDLSTRDITSQVTWSSSSATVATVSNAVGSKGRATGVGPGAATITATDSASSLFGTATITVTPLPPPPVLVTILVTPATTAVDQGGTQQYSALGTYSDTSTRDLTGAVTWTSSDTTVATISNTPGSQGVASAVGAGSATITATDPTTGTAGTAVVAVNPIAVPPVIPPVVPPVSPPPGPPKPTTRGFVVSPDNGRAGSRVQVAGWLFPAGRAVRVSYRTGGRPRQVKVCRANIRSDGTFTCPGLIPPSPKAGGAYLHTVVAKIVRAKGTPLTYGSYTLTG